MQRYNLFLCLGHVSDKNDFYFNFLYETGIILRYIFFL